MHPFVAMEINALLPAHETPRDTEGYDGFYHLTDMKGGYRVCGTGAISSVTNDAEKFEERKKTLQNIEKSMNEKWGQDTVKLTITDQYPQHVRSNLRLHASD